MPLLVVVVACAVVLFVGYRVYGGLLARLLRLDANNPTPAITLRDDVDYVPIGRLPLLNQHFSAIAAAGPIVGPILAGVMFGWLPALLWIVLGSILIGGVHDITALLASVRHRARSIAEVVREHMTPRSYVLFLLFIWFALMYVVVAFTDITASSFVGMVKLDSGEQVLGGGIATSSLLYLALPVIMGLLLRFTRLGIRWATVIFLPLVGVAIWAGQYIPFDLATVLGISKAEAHRTWNVLLLLYCFVASIVPMWILLQPRGHLGGYFLFFSLVGGMLGLILGGQTIQYPAFLGWEGVTKKGLVEPLFPVLFITVACGACSGFHAMVASGTTSKQIRTELDIKPVGYGAMLMEGMVAVVSLGCVMMLAPGSSPLQSATPNLLYATGIGSFLNILGIPMTFAVSFALMAFTTFVYDTLDVCTRLGRYVMQELLGWHGRGGRYVATAITIGVPMYFLSIEPASPSGEVVPAWQVYWKLFGASNQLLAALTLVGVTVWLWRTRRAAWVWPVTGLPALLMYTMSTWELVRIVYANLSAELYFSPLPWIATLLIALAFLMLAEAVRVFIFPGRAAPPRAGEPASIPAPA